ncbi:hypothetical protein [Pedobacter sp. MW01-1-1]|uniref:hypothetical protein n=1 Tax=Pedobacter sp. MW01-1-1 TaxID=3383027 RepID=UPI003FF08E3C
MKAPILIIKRLPALGMAIFPFILLQSEDFKKDPIILNHEKIHLKQQLELFIFGFYLLYFINYLANWIKYKNRDKAYRSIVFECEAYDFEKDLNYLKNRKPYAWFRFINQK